MNDAKGTALFQEREVWWCVLGMNIGYEQDGGTKNFERPVVILKKFNLDACLVVPLTGRPREGAYYFPVGTVGSRAATAILSQTRFIDRKRLRNKICTLEREVFYSLMKSVVRANFSL